MSLWTTEGILFWGRIIILSSFVRGRTLITEPQIQPVFVKAGNQLHLKCEQLNNYNIQWSRLPHHGLQNHDSPRVLTSDSSFNQTLYEEDGRKVSVLTKEVVGFNDSGSYRCEVVSGLDLQFAVDVYVVDIQGVDGVLTKIGGNATLHCHFLSDEPVSAKFLWFRNGRLLTSPSEKYRNDSTSESDNLSLLHISKLGESDVGNYTCHVSLRNGLNFSHVVHLFSSPHVRQFEKSKTIVEGSDLVLECNVWGQPSPVIGWFRGNTCLSSTNEDQRIEFFNSSFLVNSGLVIKNLAFSDRSDYSCVATSFINGTSFSDSTNIFIRVKGRLAPLYPLIGILVEMIVLLIIILIYERRRKKKRMKELCESADDLIVLFDKVLEDRISLQN